MLFYCWFRTFVNVRIGNYRVSRLWAGRFLAIICICQYRSTAFLHKSSKNVGVWPIFRGLCPWRSQGFDLGVYVLTSNFNFNTCVNVPHVVNKTVTAFLGVYIYRYTPPPSLRPWPQPNVKSPLKHSITDVCSGKQTSSDSGEVAGSLITDKWPWP